MYLTSDAAPIVKVLSSSSLSSIKTSPVFFLPLSPHATYNERDTSLCLSSSFHLKTGPALKHNIEIKRNHGLRGLRGDKKRGTA